MRAYLSQLIGFPLPAAAVQLICVYPMGGKPSALGQTALQIDLGTSTAANGTLGRWPRVRPRGAWEVAQGESERASEKMTAELMADTLHPRDPKKSRSLRKIPSADRIGRWMNQARLRPRIWP